MWNLWQRGPELQTIPIPEPILDPWQKSDSEPQMKLKKYVADVLQSLLPLPEEESSLFMDMRVDLAKLRDMKKGRGDLENYLSPISKNLPQRARFRLVSGEFCEEGGSTLTIGKAIQRDMNLETSWEHLIYIPTTSYIATAYKQNLSDALKQIRLEPIDLNRRIDLQMAVRCNPIRVNWINLWKPTVDALGPIVGDVKPPRLRQPFNPRDDLIKKIDLHFHSDSTKVNKVEIGLWWREVDKDK